ncbi:WD40-repeat-containing domain protein, partial [Suillus fuscotomentosus]
HNEIVMYLVFLHDNVHIVSYSDSGVMCKWNCNTGLLVREPWEDKGEDEGEDERGEIVALVLSPDGKTIACGRYDGCVERWDTDGNMIEGEWADHDGGRVKSLSTGGIAQLWDTESYQPLGEPFSQDYYNRLHHVSFSRDGRYITHGGNNSKITLW